MPPKVLPYGATGLTTESSSDKSIQPHSTNLLFSSSFNTLNGNKELGGEVQSHQNWMVCFTIYFDI